MYSIDGGTTYSATNAFGALAVGNYTVKVQDANLCVSGTTGVAIGEPAQTVGVQETTVPFATLNAAYTAFTLHGSGGTPNYTLSANSGLPTGMTITNNQLVGTPTEHGKFSFTVNVTDVNNCQGVSQPITITSCVYCDDFEDRTTSDPSPWTTKGSGQWSVVTNVTKQVQGTTSRKALMFPPAFSGNNANISIRTLEVTNATILNPGGRLFIYGWRASSTNWVRVQLFSDKGKIVVLQKNGFARKKMVIKTPVLVGTAYDIRLVYDGSTFTLFIDSGSGFQQVGNPMPAIAVPTGTGEILLRSTTGLPTSATMEDFQLY